MIVEDSVISHSSVKLAVVRDAFVSENQSIMLFNTLEVNVSFRGANRPRTGRVLAIGGSRSSLSIWIRIPHVGMEGTDPQLHISVPNIHLIPCAVDILVRLRDGHNNAASNHSSNRQRLRGIQVLRMEQEQMDVVQLVRQLVLVLLRHAYVNEHRGNGVYHDSSVDLSMARQQRQIGQVSVDRRIPMHGQTHRCYPMVTSVSLPFIY